MPVTHANCTARQRPDQQVSGCCQVSPFACTSASSGHGAPLSVLVDESDSDQILAIDELRSLRDRTGDYAPTPEPVTSAAPIQAPGPSAGAPLDARADPWEDLRRRASDRRRWGRLIAAGGCFVLTGGAVAMLIITAHLRSGRPATVEVSVPAVSAPPVSRSAPVAGSSAAEPTVPLSPTPEASAVLPMPVGAVPSSSVEVTTEPRAAAVPPVGAAARPKPPSRVAPPATRHPSSPVPANGSAPGAGPDRTGASNVPAESDCGAGCTEPTLTRTPTSWSPTSPP
jgi:hypothetical protein